MKASELRIGNWVLHKAEQNPYQVETLPVAQSNRNLVLVLFGYSPDCTIEFIEPIPLTEEWLLKFGFNKNAGEHWCERHEEFEPVDKFYKNRFCIYKNPETGEYIDTDLEVEIKHVHQLQNIYFALTGSELEIKELVKV